MSIKRTAPNYTQRPAAVLKAWFGSQHADKCQQPRGTPAELLAGPERLSVTDHIHQLASELPPLTRNTAPREGKQ